MIRFNHGYEMDFCCASGALGFNGDGYWWEQPLRWLGLLRPDETTIVCKTVTVQPRKGNLKSYKPWECVRPLGGGSFVSAIGLTNPGINVWINKHFPHIERRGYNAAPSIAPETLTEAKVMGGLLSNLNVPFIEVNISCSNTEAIEGAKEIVKTLFQFARKPIVVKLSYLQAMSKGLIVALSTTIGVQAFHAINAVPWADVFPTKRSPLESTTGVPGGVSGPSIRRLAQDAVFHIKQHTNVPVIAGGGISSLKDVHDFEDAGADAFSIGSLFLHRPWLPNKIISEYRNGD